MNRTFITLLLGTLLVPAAQSWCAEKRLHQEAQTSDPTQTEELESVEKPRSRHQMLRQSRLEKQEQVKPYVPNRVERELVRFDKSDNPTIQDLNWYGIYPRIAWPARGSGTAAGFRYWQRDFAGPLDLAGSAFYSWKSYQVYDIQFGLMPHTGQRLPDRSWRGEDVYELGDHKPGFSSVPFYGTFRYRYLPEEDYYGEGPDSKLENRSTYLLEETSLYLRTGYQFSKHAVWLVSGGYLKNTLGPGKDRNLPTTQEVFDQASAPGSTQAPDYVRMGTSVLVDYRDQPANPHKGFMVAGTVERFDDRTERAFSFNRFGVDARAIIPLGSPQRILALRGAWLIDEADPGHQVPFFMQMSLGGSHTLRGFDSFRFRGENVMLYQAEYRWEPAEIWEIALFTDTGTVSAPGSGLSFSALEWDYGVGLRFKNWRSVLVRIEVAWSRETTRYYFRTSASF